MKLKPFLNCKAVPVLMAGIAFFLIGCQLKPRPDAFPVTKTGKALFARAEQEFFKGDYDSALKDYELYLTNNPRGVKAGKALFKTGVIHYEKSRYKKARIIFNRIIREYPGHPEIAEVKYKTAAIHYHLKDYENSEREIHEWLKEYPDHPLKGESLLLMGIMGWEQNNPEAFYWWVRASGEFQASSKKGIDLDRRIVSLVENASLWELKEMLRHMPESQYSPNIYHKMATIYLEKNKLAEAKESALALIGSTSEQSWISAGRMIVEKTEEELAIKKRVVGCLLPLSGPFAIYGQEVLNGIQLGMGILNRIEDNQSLELIIKDTGGKIEGAVSGVEELTNKEKVIGIIGPLAGQPALKAAHRAQELGVPIITFTQKEGVTTEGDMVFRNFLTPSKEIKRLLNVAIGEMAWKKFGIIYPDNLYGQFFMNLFWDTVEEMGGEITAVESYKPQETDFAPEIKKMVGLFYPRPESVKKMLDEMRYIEAEEKIDGGKGLDEEPEPIVDFDAVFIPDNYRQVALITPQFPFYNVFDIHFLGTSLWQSDELIKMAGDYIQGAVFPSGFFVDSKYDWVKKFVELYNENFESDPGILAASGYDTIRFLKDLMDNSEIRTRRDFLNGLFQFYRHYGVTGWISFDHNGEVKKEPLLLTISGKHMQELE